MKIKVKPTYDGIRIEKFFREMYPGLSIRTSVKFITSSEVTVSGRRARKSTRLRKGDEVCFNEELIEEFFAHFKPEPSSWMKPTVLFRDEHILAVEKPSGVNCAPLIKGDRKTLVNAVLSMDNHLMSISGWKTREAGLLYRLDRDVSGIVLFALKQKTFEKLRYMQSSALIHKTYLAAVRSICKSSIAKGRKYQIVAEQPNYRGRKVKFGRIVLRQHGSAIDTHSHITNFTVLKWHRNSEILLEVKIKKGIRHQIRASLSQIKLPIINDSLYDPNREKRKEGGQIMLHLWKIIFPHPADEKKIEITCPVPERFHSFL